MGVHVKVGDLRLTGVELFVSLPVGPVLRTCIQYSIAVCSLPEVASRVVSGRYMWLSISGTCVQFCDPSFNRSEEIRPKAVGGGIFGRFILISIHVDRM